MTNEHTHGPPFTVDRYGSLAECVIAERDWLRDKVGRLEREVMTSHAINWQYSGGCNCEICKSFADRRAELWPKVCSAAEPKR